MQVDKAGSEYWSSSYKKARLPNPVDPGDKRLRNYVNRRFDGYFRSRIAPVVGRNAKLLEVGCAKSAWLPYFAKQFGFEIWGMDYSEVGCEQARHVLEKAGIEGTVICGDLLDAPKEVLGSFDVVVSFGLVEHFEDTVDCVRALARCAKPGGVVFTCIPNMTGMVGLVQRLLNRAVYDIHVPIKAGRLGEAHRDAGCELLECEYFVATSFGVCSLNGIPQEGVGWTVRKGTKRILESFSLCAWLLEKAIGTLPEKGVLSPYVNCLARKPTET